MKKVIKEDYTFDIDFEKTKNIYEDAPKAFEGLSQYLPELTDFLESLGIDIEKPIDYTQTNDLLYKAYGTFSSEEGYELYFLGEKKFASVCIFDKLKKRKLKEKEDTIFISVFDINLNSDDQSDEEEDMTENDSYNVVYRSLWPLGAAILLWLTTIFFGLISVFSKYINSGTGTEGYLIIIPILTFLFAVYYTICAVTIPFVLVEYREGMLHFYPSKYKSYAVNPKDIVFISQKNYSVRGITDKSGRMKIQTTLKMIRLRWVEDAEEARRNIETLKKS